MQQLRSWILTENWSYNSLHPKKGGNKSKDFTSVKRQTNLLYFAPSASAPPFSHLFQAFSMASAMQYIIPMNVNYNLPNKASGVDKTKAFPPLSKGREW